MFQFVVETWVCWVLTMFFSLSLLFFFTWENNSWSIERKKKFMFLGFSLKGISWRLKFCMEWISVLFSYWKGSFMLSNKNRKGVFSYVIVENRSWVTLDMWFSFAFYSFLGCAFMFTTYKKEDPSPNQLEFMTSYNSEIAVSFAFGIWVL